MKLLQFVIIGIIVIYFIYVIYKKIKDMKKGKFCNCGSQDCLMQDKCDMQNRKEK